MEQPLPELVWSPTLGALHHAWKACIRIPVILERHGAVRALDIDAVRAFVLVADLRSFTRAAEAMDVTQPVVSVRLRKLEQKLGRRLLERTPRDVRLSIEGAAFLEAARALVTTHDRAATAFNVVEQRLAVGISQLLIGNDLPRLLSRIAADNPSLKLTVRVGGTSDLIASFENGDLDAALVLEGRQGFVQKTANCHLSCCRNEDSASARSSIPLSEAVCQRADHGCQREQ